MILSNASILLTFTWSSSCEVENPDQHGGFLTHALGVPCGKEEPMFVVGGGCFGISTAYHLFKREFKNVTAVDRSDVLLVPDAASTDLSQSSDLINHSGRN
jgi:hypothetical protein